MTCATTDLSDAHPDALVLDAILRPFGGARRFFGRARTVRCFEDNTLVRAALETPGDGGVLVVDGGGSLRCALVGGNLGSLAVRHGWAGIVVFGCVRDVAELAPLPVGILALAAHPRKSVRRGWGVAGEAVSFGGVTVREGDWVYADEDGVVVSSTPLHPV
jgi:regulator of ribonuclease activity A